MENVDTETLTNLLRSQREIIWRHVNDVANGTDANLAREFVAISLGVVRRAVRVLQSRDAPTDVGPIIKELENNNEG